MSLTFQRTAKVAVQSLVIASASLALSLTFADSAQAQVQARVGVGHAFHGGGGPGWHAGGHYAPRYYGGGGWRRGGNGWVWGGVGLGLGLGIASYYNSYPYYVSPAYAVAPPVVYEAPVYAQPVYTQPVYSQPVPSRNEQPVIYPRNGQSAQTMDADANACSEWAGQQPNATRDTSVFRRGLQACMDARGYTVR